MYGFAQRELDSESGLVHVRARMYDPKSGRFTQTDPLRRRRAGSHYLYGSNRPGSRVDPLGLEEWNPQDEFGQRVKAYFELYYGDVGGNELLKQFTNPEGFNGTIATGDVLFEESRYWSTLGTIYIDNDAGRSASIAAGHLLNRLLEALPQNKAAILDKIAQGKYVGDFGSPINEAHAKSGLVPAGETAEAILSLNPGGMAVSLLHLWEQAETPEEKRLAMGMAILAVAGVRVPGEKAVNIALGHTASRARNPILRAFATRVGAHPWMDWEHLYIVKMASRPESFKPVFHEAVSRVLSTGGKIHFNLEEVQFTAAMRLAREGKGFGQYPTLTQWELSEIVRSKELWQNTIFYFGDLALETTKDAELLGKMGIRYIGR